jgi:putative aminopeptidase FrvX
MKSLNLIKELALAHGTSGFETEVRELITKLLAEEAAFSQDNLGSLICKKEGSQSTPKIMLPGHMDEIGLMVNSITKSGYLKFVPLGGWWDQVMLAQRVVVKTRKGDVQGIIGSIPPHLLSAKDREKIVEKKEMYIDVGAKDKEEAEKTLGIQLGDPVVPDSSFCVLNNTGKIMSKALDNRLGCALFIDVIKGLQNITHPNTVYGVGTVQEEVGLRGAVTAANIIEPDICLTLDVAIATDTPGLEKEDSEVKLGGGPVLTLADASMIGNRSLRSFVIDTAREAKIDLQFNTMMGGGTDGGAVHKFGPGVPTVVLSIPTRYLHSHYSVFDYSDYESTLELLLLLVQVLDSTRVKQIKLGSY